MLAAKPLHFFRMAEAPNPNPWAFPMLTTLGKVVLAMRAHHEDPNTEEKPTPAERNLMQITAIESARLFGGLDEALQVREHVSAKSDEEWWQHQFLLHVDVFQFLHHRLREEQE